MTIDQIVEANEPFASDEDRELFRQDVRSGEAFRADNGEPA